MLVDLSQSLSPLAAKALGGSVGIALALWLQLAPKHHAPAWGNRPPLQRNN
jgi:hypothetical protein